MPSGKENDVDLKKQDVVVTCDAKSTSITSQWYHTDLEGTEQYYPPRPNTFVKPYNCGSEMWKNAAAAIKAAQKTIEIKTWMFDPAFLIQGYSEDSQKKKLITEYVSDNSPFSRIPVSKGPLLLTNKSDHPRLGDLLLEAAARGVEVRIMVWNLGDLAFNPKMVTGMLNELSLEFDFVKEFLDLTLDYGRKAYGVLEEFIKAHSIVSWIKGLKSYLIKNNPGTQPVFKNIDELTQYAIGILGQKDPEYYYRLAWFLELEQEPVSKYIKYAPVGEPLKEQLQKARPRLEPIVKKMTAEVKKLNLDRELDRFKDEVKKGIFKVQKEGEKLVEQLKANQANYMKIFEDLAASLDNSDRFLQKNFPTHHQKTLMVDYVKPDKAVGYVLGGNFKAVDFDSPEHPYKAPKKGGRYPKEPPRQDIHCLVNGEALYDINDNFCRYWDKESGQSPLQAARSHLKPESFKGHQGHAQVSCTVYGGLEGHEDRGYVLDAYKAAIQCATRYVYIENQYFRYAALTEHLKAVAEKRLELKCNANGEPLYYFVVVLEPGPGEDGGTYETMESLGHQEQMPKTKAEREGGQVIERHEAENAEDAFKVLEQQGIKGLVATMRIPSPHYTGKEVLGPSGQQYPVAKFKSTRTYKPVSIHSKLLLVDDVFMLSGSANFNHRGMVSDAEMNIGVANHNTTYNLRKNLFLYHLGEYSSKIEDSDWKSNYEIWKQMLDENWRKMNANEMLAGYLVYFYDTKSKGDLNLD